MAGKQKKAGLDVDYLRTATSAYTLPASVLATQVQEKQQQLLHEQQPQQIAIERLLNNPYQPRLTMEPESLQQLSATIASHGFQGVLVARPHPQQIGYYQITAGHRRREAARMADIRTLPVLVHGWSDQEMAALAATENIQREDLSPLEEGRLFQTMINQMTMTQVEVAQAIKKDRGYVRNRLRLANAPDDIQAFVSTKTDSMRAVVYLLDIEDPAERAPIIEQLLKKTLTTEDLPAYIEEMKQQKAQPQPSPLASKPYPTLPTSKIPNIQSPEIGVPSPSAIPHIAPAQSDTSYKQETPAFKQLQTTSNPIPVDNTTILPTPTISTPTPSTPRPPAPAMSEERIRQTRLKTVLRYLKDYQNLLAKQDKISSEERQLLQEIITYARQLLNG